MKSVKAIDLIKTFEGCSSKNKEKSVILSEQDKKDNILVFPYICLAGKKTIGYGNLIRNSSKYDDGIPYLSALELLQKSLATYEAGVNRNITAALSQNQFDALVCLVYNIGEGNFAKSTLCKVINANKDNLEKIKEEWLKWCRVKGKILPGLQRRRLTEFNLYAKDKNSDLIPQAIDRLERKNPGIINYFNQLLFDMYCFFIKA